MRKAQVELNKEYGAKVSGKYTHVRIDREARKGWYATNLRTGREVYIRTAARLTHG